MTKKPRRQRLEKPDEFFSKGPLQVARFGKNVVIRSNWQEGEHAKMLSRLAARHPIVVEEIDQLIDQIANLVKVLPPAQLLYRAWWMKATSGLHIKAEAEVGPEDALAMRMIDYIQSIIASVIPFETPKDTLSDEDWTELSNLVEELFQKLNGEFHLSATAKRKIENENYDESLEEFHFKSQIYWCNVRGNQYQNHQLDSLAELLIPQSSVVEAVFGISSEKIIEELAKIWNSLTFGIKNAFEEFDNFKTISLNAMEADIESGLVDSNLPPHEIMAETLKRHSLNDVHESAMGKLMGMDLFDVEKLTKLPIQFLDEFSWTPGQDINFFSEGPSKGWPLRIWPTFIKPFIKIDSKYLLARV